MVITSHLFRGLEDLEDLKQFVSAIRASGARSFFHPGDIIWGIYQNTIFDPSTNICIWRDETGAIVSFAWLEPGRTSFYFSLVVRPDLRFDDQFYDLAFSWLKQRQEAVQNEEFTQISTQTFEDDQPLLAALHRYGFVRDEGGMYYLERDLSDEIPAPVLPEGWQVRHVAGEHEFEERVETHRDVWNPSRVTIEAYRRLRTIPGYDPELDIAAFSPDGTIGSYCICWYDERTHWGEFEPVGTRAAYRRQGIGRTVMLEGLRRLQARGAQTALVLTNHGNDAALGLYQSVGFRVRVNLLTYAKKFRA